MTRSRWELSATWRVTATGSSTVMVRIKVSRVWVRVKVRVIGLSLGSVAQTTVAQTVSLSSYDMRHDAIAAWQILEMTSTRPTFGGHSLSVSSPRWSGVARPSSIVTPKTVTPVYLDHMKRTKVRY